MNRAENYGRRAISTFLLQTSNEIISLLFGGEIL
jgi:hypothetical protein